MKTIEQLKTDTEEAEAMKVIFINHSIFSEKYNSTLLACIKGFIREYFLIYKLEEILNCHIEI